MELDDTHGTRPDEAKADETLGRFIAAALERQTDLLLSSLPLAADGSSTEAVHDARIALRRMRVCLGIFPRDERAKCLRKLDDRISKLGRRLGAIRDLDVMIEEARAYSKKFGEDRSETFSPFIEELANRRQAALENFRTRYPSGVLEDLRKLSAKAVQRLSEGARDVPPRPASAAVLAVVPAAFAELAAYRTPIAGGDFDEGGYHRIRGCAKRLRYTLELFEPVLGPGAKRIAAEAKALQTSLGSINDASIASRLAASYLSGRIEDGVRGTGAPDPFPEVARFLSGRQAKLRSSVAALPAAWRRISSAAFRKRLFSLLGSFRDGAEAD